MNREIEFKAKDKNDNWVYEFGDEINTNTVCKYTGLKDKHGNRIYERDILETKEHLFIVYYYENKFLPYCINGENCINNENNFAWSESQVVGNIYDKLKDITDKLQEIWKGII